MGQKLMGFVLSGASINTTMKHQDTFESRILTLRIDPDFDLERTWYRVKSKAHGKPFEGHKTAWNVVAHHCLLTRIPDWKPERGFRALPGTFNNWFTAFDAVLVFDEPRDKAMTEQALSVHQLS